MDIEKIIKDTVFLAVQSTKKEQSGLFVELSRTLERIETNVKNLSDHVNKQNGRIDKLEEKIYVVDKANCVENAVSVTEVGLLKKIIYAGIAVILTAVIVAGINKILK